MLDSLDISRLYENVLVSDMIKYNISDKEVKFGIANMQHVYGETVGLTSERSIIADYTDPGHRCAYMHKYAALHTAMVRDMLGEAVNLNFNFFHRLLFSGKQFRMCSLGGGPGTDVIGALATLHAAFGYFDTSVTVVDYMTEWSYSFDSILKELSTGWYGAFGNNISYYMQWQYVQANLLKPFKPDVLQALSSATLVTMVKFTSAAACMDTYSMIKKIFMAMKPGAALLFIDNDGGGFHSLIADGAKELNFRSIFGPLRRESYYNTFFKKTRFGYPSCCKTTVTVHLLQKPLLPYDLISDPFYLPYANQYASNNCRRVILKNNQSLLNSPPTPYLYFCQSPDENGNLIKAQSSLLELPHTPYLNPGATNDRLGYSSAHEVQPGFSHDENYIHPGFVSPFKDLRQSPAYNIINTPSVSGYRSVNSPATQPRGKRARMQGCFPKITNFKHHIAKKMNKVKSRARSILKKKNKKTHPIFEL